MTDLRPSVENAARAGGKLLILVVERDPHIRELEAHFLNEAGYAVDFAVDGRAALQHAQQCLPDIVLTEILVPKLDGLALCRQLKADPKTRDIAVLVFSILAASARATEAGADAFLLKPLAEHRLVGTVKTLMGRRTQARGEDRT
jgi:CheY-like chemotaxis protein